METRNILDKEFGFTKGVNLPDLASTNWFKVVRRENSPLFETLVRIGATLKNPEFSFDNSMPSHLVLESDVFACVDEVTNLKKIMIEKAEKDPDFINNYFEKLIHDSNAFLEWSKQDHSVEDPLEFFTEFKNRCILLMTHLWPPLGPEEWIMEQIESKLSQYIDPVKDFAGFKQALSVLTMPDEQSNIQVRKEAMLDIVANTADFSNIPPEIQEQIDRTHHRFAWLTDHGLHFEYETKDEFIAELKKIENPEKELEKIKQNQENFKTEAKALTSKHNFDSRLLGLCDTAKRFPYVRFFRVEVLIEGAYHMRATIENVRKATGLDDLSLAYYWEIQDILKGKPVDTDIISQRKNGFSYVFLKDTFFDIDKQKSQELRQKLDPEENLEELKGQSACLGKATGTARVLISAKENNKVEQGDILITSMTTPDYVPAMEKAAAIVTNEGGITCHASIVSREMGKPCIIGTKKATKVFKDGDLVEVDADQGIIRRINS
jgi:phosphohistidine swiveling domain-containing protein